MPTATPDPPATPATSATPASHEAEAIPAPTSTLRLWARRLGPWLLAFGVLGFLFSRYSPAKIWALMSQATVWPLFPIGFLMMLLSLFLVSQGDVMVVRHLLGAPNYYDMLRAKAASSLIDIINYHAGHAAYAVWFARRTGGDGRLAAGAMLYIMSSDLTAVCSVAAASALFASGAPAGVRTIALSVGATLLLLKMIGPFDFAKGAGPRIFRPWALIRQPRALGQLSLRIAQHIGFVLMTYWAVRSFGLPIPFWAIVAYLPIATLVSALPLNVAGFGTVQAVWVFFFSPFASGEKILAFQLVWTIVGVFSVFLRGIFFLRGWVAELDEGKAPEAPAA